MSALLATRPEITEAEFSDLVTYLGAADGCAAFAALVLDEAITARARLAGGVSDRDVLLALLGRVELCGALLERTMAAERAPAGGGCSERS